MASQNATLEIEHCSSGVLHIENICLSKRHPNLPSERNVRDDSYGYHREMSDREKSCNLKSNFLKSRRRIDEDPHPKK